MNSMSPSAGGEPRPMARPVLPRDSEFHTAVPAERCLPAELQLGPRRVGYGLPCAHCKTYYAADLPVCPVCKTDERVLPAIGTASTTTSAPPPEPAAAAPVLDEQALELERDRFLREYAAQAEPVATMPCTLEENHQGEVQPAAVCQSCYVSLQERLDLLEAALHMDLKEVTDVIYKAVWSDPSDPTKTYQNAAQAVLSELHKRAGISGVLGSHQALAH